MEMITITIGMMEELIRNNKVFGGEIDGGTTNVYQGQWFTILEQCEAPGLVPLIIEAYQF